MKHKTNKLREAIGLALAAGVIGVAGNAFAQDTNSEVRSLTPCR